jgi:hypothetical protein
LSKVNGVNSPRPTEPVPVVAVLTEILLKVIGPTSQEKPLAV